MTETNIAEIIQQAEQVIESIDNLKDLEQIKVTYLGRNGKITEMLKMLGKLPAEKRSEQGKVINQAKQQIIELLNSKTKYLEAQALTEKLATEAIDVTLPGRGQDTGSLHPVTLVMQRIEDFFINVGFSIETGPEIEDEFHNFIALNIPENHPARAMQDTFYMENGNVLRTHTSPVQIRTLEKQKPPVKIIAPGRVYRCDSDVTHTPMFHQVEALVIDEHTNFTDLKGILQAFFEYFFERKLALRFRPSYFPFTEPSAEVDIECTNCNGSGCRVCGQSGWLEIMGCGMVHPNVLKAVNIDPEQYQGYAFGCGVDRLAMLRYGIDDLRILFENDQRFLQQFVR